MEQRIINRYSDLDEWLDNVKKPFVVGSLKRQENLRAHLPNNTVVFSDYQPNPLYENVQAGVKLFREEGCDAIIAVGGGSAMDVAKCIKLYGNLPGDGGNGGWLEAEYAEYNIPFLAMPTTAGTGSEATRYAVIYYDGKKQSVTSESFIPDTVLMDPNTLITLPLYQKKATMCDALCHAIESFWSVNSTDESKEYSRRAIELVIANMDGYLENTEEGRSYMLLAANTAGKAINITQTTAGHAMCYKIISLFGSAHGHAVFRQQVFRKIGKIIPCFRIWNSVFSEQGMESIPGVAGNSSESNELPAILGINRKIRRLYISFRLTQANDHVRIFRPYPDTRHGASPGFQGLTRSCKQNTDYGGFPHPVLPLHRTGYC